MRTTVIFDNFGPYHLARLRAAASVTELLAVEVAASSAEYAWKREAQDGGQKPDAGGRRTEVSGQQGTSNIEHPTSNIQTAESAECGAQSGEPEDGGRRTEGRRQKTEDGAESRKQKTENKKKFQLSAFSVSAFKNVTLLEAGTSRDVSHRELAARLNRALDDFRPQVVFIPGWSSKVAFAALRWCVRHNIPAVAMSESTEWDEARSAWREAVKQRIVGLCSAALVGGSPHKDYLVQLGMPVERVFFGYDAVDNGYFAQSAREARSAECGVRSKYGLPGHYFLASARFIEKKNLPRLIQACARYREMAQKSEDGRQKAGNTSPRPSPHSGEGDAPWDLVLLGDGPLRSSILNLRSSLGLDACVHLPGFKQYPELPAYYGLAGAFIHASTTEQWGLVVNEAMASGLPVLVSNHCGCAADLVQEGGNGFTFDPDNVEQLAQLMLKISALPSPPQSGRGQGEVSSSASEPSTFNLQPSTTLAQMGQASQRIIANWGPERFASGLKAAAGKAVEVGPKHASWFDRLLLQGLFSR